MIKLVTALSIGLILNAPHVNAQDFGSAVLGGIARESAKSAEEFLETVPDRFSDLVGSNNKEYDTARVCLSELQMFINAAVVVSDLMPFSRVWTEEIDGTATATLRLMVDGEKVHARISCQDQLMVTELLGWDAPTPATEPYQPGPLAASLGILLSMQQRNGFAEPEEDAQESNRKTARGTKAESKNESSHNVPSVSAADAVNQALEGALGSGVKTSAPLTAAEKDAFRLSVQNCWNVGSLSDDALRTVIVVGTQLNEDGRPVVDAIELIEYSGGDEMAAEQAFEAARRAIIRCGAQDFDLPKDKYDQWREIKLTFDPNDMRIK